MSHLPKGVAAAAVAAVGAVAVAVVAPRWEAAVRSWEAEAQVWEEAPRCREPSMRHPAHTQETDLLAAASLRPPVNRRTGTPELTGTGNGTVVIGSIRVIVIMATTIVAMGTGSLSSAASMMIGTTLATTIATSGAVCTHGMDGGGVDFMSAIIDG